MDKEEYGPAPPKGRDIYREEDTGAPKERHIGMGMRTLRRAERHIARETKAGPPARRERIGKICGRSAERSDIFGMGMPTLRYQSGTAYTMDGKGNGMDGVADTIRSMPDGGGK